MNPRNTSFLINDENFELIIHNRDQVLLNTISIIDMVIILLGSIGNLTSFYLLTRKRLRPVSSMRYLASLTLVDTLCLYGWYLSSVYRQLNTESHLKRLENMSALSCKLISYLSFCTLQLSSVLLCMLTIDRLLIITSSLWRSKYANPKQANRIILILTALILILNLIIPVKLGNKGFVQYKIKNFNDENDNQFNLTMWHCYDDNDIILTVWNKLHLLLYSLAPFPVLSILNLIVIRMTRDAARSATQLGACFKKFKHGQQFVTRLLLFLSVSFVFTTLPSTIVYAFWHHQILEIRYGRVLLNLLNTLQFSRHSSNWIIYVYSSSFMREELKKCLSCTDSEYELAQAALAERPSVAIEILRRIEQVQDLNNCDTIGEQDQVDLYYLYCYYEKNNLIYMNNYSNTNFESTNTNVSRKNHNSYNFDDSDCKCVNNSQNENCIFSKKEIVVKNLRNCSKNHELIVEDLNSDKT